MLELLAVFLTALGKFIFMDLLEWRLSFIAAAIVLWTAYVFHQNRRNPGITRYWGFRTDNFGAVIRKILPFGILSLVVFILIGIYQDTVNITWHMIPILILYPIWGVIQQFLLIALTAGNLQDLENVRLPKGFITVLAAALFGAIHYPYVWLICGTFILGVFYAMIYFQQRNIYALGVFHGWLGALFFYTVVDRDPFLETFGSILNIS